jgi:TorA maturation chaperone TorD
MTDQDKIVIRGNCFKLLAACFYEPEKELFIEEKVCDNLKNLLNEWASDAAKAAGEMDLCLENISQEQLSIDHAALFVGPFELTAAPYGSVYAEDSRQLMGETTINTLRFYEDAGLSVDVKEPPDHIAIELEFMSHLCSKEAESSSAGNHGEAEKFREMQVQFFRTALQWVPQFCDSIRKGSDNLFYQSLADCLSRFMVSCDQVYSKVSITST